MRLRPFALLLSGVAVASSACADTAATSPLAAPQGAVFSQASKDDDAVAEHETERHSFLVDPTRANHLEFDSHSLDLPANSICSATAGFGHAWWDAPCVTATSKIHITVVVTSTSNRLPRVDFEPAIRFNPRTTVALRLQVEDMPESAATYSVLYCATPGSICVDESLNDPSLASIYDAASQILYRRIKHFSGYLVAERY